jgi:aspartyl-tRNA synthetase
MCTGSAMNRAFYALNTTMPHLDESTPDSADDEIVPSRTTGQC